MTTTTLEFEQPIADLEKKILEMRGLSESLDIQPQIEELEARVANMEAN